MIESDATGTPFGKSAACWFCFVPAEISVTVPLITTESAEGLSVCSGGAGSSAHNVDLVIIAVERSAVAVCDSVCLWSAVIVVGKCPDFCSCSGVYGSG